MTLASRFIPATRCCLALLTSKEVSSAASIRSSGAAGEYIQDLASILAALFVVGHGDLDVPHGDDVELRADRTLLEHHFAARELLEGEQRAEQIELAPRLHTHSHTRTQSRKCSAQLIG